jgi:hypothetical protein
MVSKQSLPFQYTIHEDERYVEVCFYGTINVNTVLTYLQHVWLNKPSLAGFSELVDFRLVDDIDINTGELANLVIAGRALDDSSQSSKIAMISNDPYTFFKGELYQTLQQLYPAKNKAVEIFKDEDTARHWLIGA